MIITKTFDINDEPMIARSSGKRSAEIKYSGRRYVYAELCNISKKILIMIHSSQNPEPEIALERLTPNEDRSVVEIDASENTLAAAIISDLYELSVDDYVEDLPNGEKFEYEYPQPPKLSDIFRIHEMTYNVDKNDFDEYLFITNDITSEEFIGNVNQIISNTKESLETNQYSSEQATEINNFLSGLQRVISEVEQGIPHWKVNFPVCSVTIN